MPSRPLAVPTVLTIALCDPEHPAALSMPSTASACASLRLLSRQDGVQGPRRRWYMHPGLRDTAFHTHSVAGASSTDSPTHTCPSTGTSALPWAPPP